MEHDIILRHGEIAEEFYFIKEGRVEVLATDGKSVIAILEKGSYFGEIGLLMTGSRTVTIRAMTYCVFMCLNKEGFFKVLNLYPDIR